VLIEYDPAKDQANVAKHGLPLAFGARIFGDDDHLVLSSERAVDGEHRYKVIGMVGKLLYTAVYVPRGSATRFISVRRSNDGEERAYRRP
jgi:uncharacterized DUF497 family protein